MKTIVKVECSHDVFGATVYYDDETTQFIDDIFCSSNVAIEYRLFVLNNKEKVILTVDNI